MQFQQIAAAIWCLPLIITVVHNEAQFVQIHCIYVCINDTHGIILIYKIIQRCGNKLYLIPVVPIQICLCTSPLLQQLPILYHM